MAAANRPDAQHASIAATASFSGAALNEARVTEPPGQLAFDQLAGTAFAAITDA
jgi:hypothetical protein